MRGIEAIYFRAGKTSAIRNYSKSEEGTAPRLNSRLAQKLSIASRLIPFVSGTT